MIKLYNKIAEKDDKLLRKEAYLRKARYAYFSSGLIIILGVIVYVLLKPIDENFSNTPLWLFFLCIAIGYETHLKIKHIESIKYYRSREKDNSGDNNDVPKVK